MLKQYKCTVCGHQWVPRKEEPKWCPRCHNNWRQEARRHAATGTVRNRRCVNTIPPVRPSINAIRALREMRR